MIGIVDALQIDRGDAEVAVAELALDDDQRDAFAGHLDGVGVAELVRSEAASDAGGGGGAAQLGRVAVAAGVRRRFAPHQLRHAHAVEMAREGVPLVVIQRQLGHSDLGITSVYLQGIDSGEIIETVHARHAPMVPASTSLRL